MSERCTCAADGCICDRCAEAFEAELDKQIRKLEVAITGRTVRCERCAELEAERERLRAALKRERQNIHDDLYEGGCKMSHQQRYAAISKALCPQGSPDE